VVAEPEFFVSDPSGTIGPLTPPALREALRERVASQPMVRVAQSSTWLPAFAWEAAGVPEQAPSPPPLPVGGPSTVLPSELAELTPKMREKLLWYVSDADGLSGPLSGGAVREGLASGKIAPTAKLCMAASQEWVRAPIVFPKVVEGTTAARTRPFAVIPCMFCFEPIVATDKACNSCGEPVLRGRPLGRVRIAAIGLLVHTALLGLGVGGVVLLRGRGAASLASPSGGASASAAASSADEAASGSLSAQPRVPPAAPEAREGKEASAPLDRQLASARPASGRAAPAAGHLAGEVAAKMDVSPDAVDVLALPRDRIAVARKESVEVLDAKSGALAFTIAELRGLRALSLDPAGEAVYGLGPNRIAVVDPVTVRALKWIELGAPPGVLAMGEGMALSPLSGEPSVAVIDASRHAEIERFRFDERVTSVAVDAKGQLAVAATSDAQSPRLGEDAVLTFDPSRLASAQPLRRVYVGAAPVAVAVAPSGSMAAVALLSSAAVARVDFSTGGRAEPSLTRQKTCAEPILLRFAAPSGPLLVGCRAGRAVALHDASSLAQIAQIDLGGPVLGLEVAPDGLQALVVVGPPAASVGVLDLAPPGLRRLAVSDEIASARYGPAGVTGVLFSVRAHRVWVLR
jgi:hypothetical protein